VEAIFLGSTSAQAIFTEMLLKTHIKCECEKKTVIIHVIYGRYMLALTNAKINDSSP